MRCLVVEIFLTILTSDSSCINKLSTFMYNERPLEGSPDLPFARVGLFFSFRHQQWQYYFVVAMLIVACCCAKIPLSAQVRERDAAVTGEPLLGAITRYEVDNISFTGNTAFPNDLLAAVISSRPSEKTLGRQFVSYLATELRRNPATPKHALQAVQRLQKESSENARYFDKLAAAADTALLAAYYRRNGFHRVTVEFEFLPNTQTRQNTLLFRIQENAPTLLDTIAYYGLENIAPELRETIQRCITLQRGTRFNQSDITTQNERILAALRDNGYYTARYKKPILSLIENENSFSNNPLDTSKQATSSRESESRDSVTVLFEPGARKRFGTISYVDSSATYSYLSPAVPLAFVEIKESDWYNEAAIVRSVNNLYNFGLFDLALVDTSSRITPHTDTSLSMRVLTRTRRTQNTDAGLFVGQIPGTSFLEAGGSFRYENKNLFGNAQILNLQTQVTVVDINTFINNLFAGRAVNTRLEFLLSGRFAYPLFAKVLGRRVDFNGQLSYSLQSLAFLALQSPLLLETFKLSLSFPVQLPQSGVFTSFFADINLDRQRPINFLQTREEALKLARLPSDSLIVRQQLFQYELLNNLYSLTTTPFLTSSIISFGLRGDHRDNVFSPRKGYFVDASLDGAGLIGASEFVRIAGEARWYEALSKQSVFAARIRAGYTYLFRPETAFVPLDRHFFAGGSNSVRAWNVRELRYSAVAEQTGVSQELRFVGQFVGSGTVLEGSAEWRYNFAEQYNEYGDFFERQFARLGISGFVDWGNAYNSYLEPQRTLSLADIAQNLALAAGIGIRYDTSVGPFRVDFAWRVFDPASKQWLFDRANLLPNIQIGLGHAF